MEVQAFVNFVGKQKKESLPTPFLSFGCGDGEIRTLVQTRKQYAFYMLSFDLVVGSKQAQNHQLATYLLKFRNASGEQAPLSSI